ncbi:N-6 DNA methylase [Furfurilactobacillus siliginis]|uniref:Methylase n=1 Tax=Furfurilactobacillus siliginis TaxID=348151 RepID=A0A0R2LBX4_9LACO|nr:N-6 DNA methylase [Furfurilactobacillus siliginis]KRN97206.1 hypothetical protein IV55_GL000129 [Furfurilactobacillus siliginis]GEK29321.1 methylase [Furfurilactobacillus siliginis]
MPEERIIKSNQRVKDHGEVFTPSKVVKLMIRQPEIQDNLNSLESTFLEPSAGEGAFLVEILKQKLHLANSLSSSIDEYNENSLVALSSLYGIELLEDNVERLVMNMFGEYFAEYINVVTKYKVGKNQHVLDSAKVIIQANMVQGNTLTRLNNDGEELLFSEWKMLPISHGVKKVRRLEYTLNSILDKSGPVDSYPETVNEEIDLFSGTDIPEIDPAKIKKTVDSIKYVDVNIVDVYKKLVQ